MKSIIVGTAGHIDHGKTALVRALTGIDADRLPEEKRRGITIDIGFADLDLGEVKIGFIDVPGHERFVNNMLAGAHGIDAVALVIAADESVMPQTREHFDICRLLGVQKGIVVLTKKDLADDELVELARSEAEELVQGSFLEGAPIIAVSSRTGEGVEELKAALSEIGTRVLPRSDEYIARLPIDRAFTMKGFGAVVTGTLIAGQISEADELELLPVHTQLRVRGVQVHGAAVKTAVAGQRTAINLGGIDVGGLQRGMLLAAPKRLRSTQIIDASISVLGDVARGLRSRQRVRVHLGAAELLARVRVLSDEGVIKPGGAGYVQLRFESPLVGVLGDRFIVRSYSPQVTIAGGTIIDPFAPKHRARDFATTRDALHSIETGSHATQLQQFVVNASRHGLSYEEIAARTAWRDEVIEGALAEAIAGGAVIKIDRRLISAAAFNELEQQITEALAVHHKREPLARGLPKEVLRERFFPGSAPDFFRVIINELEKRGSFVAEKDVLRLRDHTVELSPEDARLRDALENAYRGAGLAAPSVSDAAAQAGVNAATPHGRRLLQLLIDAGTLVKVHGEMYFHREALDQLIRQIRQFADANADRTIDVTSFKTLTGSSRKYAIPLLEYLDRQYVTRREGDRRVIL